MHDVGQGECSWRLTRQRHAHPLPSDQGHHHEHQARQRRCSRADEDVKDLLSGKRRQHILLHGGFSLQGSMPTVDNSPARAEEADEPKYGLEDCFLLPNWLYFQVNSSSTIVSDMFFFA
jgi:hypothetical protein